ncbi:Alpha/Beta hydrolase protein [Phellopilus nigrolimitatus]|nr:Alpha/Beta hydrolase protein [Phellopilus nigrolimitatus]
MHLAFAISTLWIAVNVAFGVDPLVTVGNTKHLGTALPNGITQWLGIRFAAPPVGDLRFRAPADPPANNTVHIADAHGAVCLSTGSGFPVAGESEDCLFLDVFAPTNASTAARLPVFFFIQGGGFNEDSNANYNASGLIKAADMDLVVVTFNYRVGPYGFLASKEVQKNGNINVGLLDQRKVLAWVHDHISKFGGDPGHVVLGGDSAGAESITLHLTAFSGAPTNLFHAVIAESQSFPTTLTVSQAQFQYDALAERVGCANESDTLACLRATNISTLQKDNIAIPFPGRENPPDFLYNAIVDGDFLVDFPFNLFAQGKFIKVPSVFGDDTNEGTIFTPTDLNTTSDMNNFLLDNFPNLTSSMLNTIDVLYPESSQFSGHGAFYFAAATAYGEMRYICPGIFISQEINKTRSPLPNWNYHYNVTDKKELADGLGVPHTIEIHAIWGPNNTNGGSPKSYFTTNAAIVPVMQGYWTSFIRTFDPNTFRASGSPEWVPFGDGQQRILFETNATRMETVPAGQTRRCSELVYLFPFRGNSYMKSLAEIGVALTSFGGLFMLLGVILFFDGSLLALGNILFLSGITLIIGPHKTFYFFARKQKLRGTLCFFGGVLLVFFKWPFIGVIVETFGFLNLFGDFFPVILTFLRQLPLIGNMLSMPYVRDVADRMAGSRQSIV